MGSGAILTEAVKAAHQLADGIDVEVYSVTSWSELARDGQFVARQLAQGTGPIIAATDYVGGRVPRAFELSFRKAVAMHR